MHLYMCVHFRRTFSQVTPGGGRRHIEDCVVVPLHLLQCVTHKNLFYYVRFSAADLMWQISTQLFSQEQIDAITDGLMKVLCYKDMNVRVCRALSLYQRTHILLELMLIVNVFAMKCPICSFSKVTLNIGASAILLLVTTAFFTGTVFLFRDERSLSRVLHPAMHVCV